MLLHNWHYMECGCLFPPRLVLWWWSLLGGAAPSLHMSLLWQNGLHRDVPAGACGCRAYRDLHRSGKLVLHEIKLDVCADINSCISFNIILTKQTESVSEWASHCRILLGLSACIYVIFIVLVHSIIVESPWVSFWVWNKNQIASHGRLCSSIYSLFFLYSQQKHHHHWLIQLRLHVSFPSCWLKKIFQLWLYICFLILIRGELVFYVCNLWERRTSRQGDWESTGEAQSVQEHQMKVSILIVKSHTVPLDTI